MKKILATGALAGGGATATVLAGQSLLSPEEEEVIILEETPAPEGGGLNNQALLAAAVLAAGGGGVLASDEVDNQLEELTQKPGRRRTGRLPAPQTHVEHDVVDRSCIRVGSRADRAAALSLITGTGQV